MVGSRDEEVAACLLGGQQKKRCRQRCEQLVHLTATAITSNGLRTCISAWFRQAARPVAEHPAPRTQPWAMGRLSRCRRAITDDGRLPTTFWQNPYTV